MTKGKFIIIEGIDGSGKATQVKKLADFLKSKGRQVVAFDFPRYTEPSSYFLKKYLNGEYGALNDLNPRLVSILFSIDRFDAKSAIEEALSADKIVLSNRFIASNLAHQGAKVSDPEERKEYFQWIKDLEFNIFEIPRPDLNVILNVSPDLVQNLVDYKGHRDYIKSRSGRDIHESDLEHLKRASLIYKEIAEIFPDDFVMLECMEEDRLLSIDEVHQKIIEIVLKIL